MTHPTILTATPVGPLGTEAALVSIVTASNKPGALLIANVSPARAKEISVRVRSAISAIGRETPAAYVEVSAPDSALPGPSSAGFDLAIVLGLLGPALADASGLVVLGEVGLDGSVRGVRGVLAATELATAHGLGVLVPAANAAEALAVEGARVYAIRHLAELANGLPAPMTMILNPEARDRLPLLSELRGTDLEAVAEAIRTTVAARRDTTLRGRPCDLVLTGAPSTSKTMIARRICSLLPAMITGERLEVTKIYSALGLVTGGLIEHRPFRAPHHTISTAALVGTSYRPGEVHLATHGVLLLDEVDEFSVAALEVLGCALAAMGEGRPMLVVTASDLHVPGDDARKRRDARMAKALTILGLTKAPRFEVPIANLRAGGAS